MTFTRILLVLPCMASICPSTSGQYVARFDHSSRVGPPSPLSLLPKHVVAPEGQLTLYADYASVTDETVTLYLVNRTSHPLGFNSLDRDIYVKLEAFTADDQWERAQTHWSGPICGNSIMVVNLPTGYYFRFTGYFPSDGEERPVRFRIYRDRVYLLPGDAPAIIDFTGRELEETSLEVVSNVGDGKVPQEAIEAARHDGLTARFGTFESVRELALGKTRLGLGQDRSSSIQALARFSTEESLAVVRELLDGPDRSTSMAAMRALAKMGLKLESAERLYQKMLRSDVMQTRMEALFAFEDRAATPEIIRYAKEQLSHDELPVRVGAMHVLASQCAKDVEMKAFINSIYDSPDPKIQTVFETALYPTCINYEERGRKGQFRRQKEPNSSADRKPPDSG